MKRILVNATQQEELRVAVVDGQKLCNLDIETPADRLKKGSIYKGVVTSVAPSLNAAFVDYGAERHGFLPFKDIARARGGDSGRGPVKEGQQLVVQIAREERGDKGSLLTTYISLVSRYLVLMPNNSKAGGVSQRIEGEDREEARDALQKLDRHDGEGVIVRTAGINRDAGLLQRDLDYLRVLWRAICKAGDERAAPFLIYQESNIVVQAMRDYMHEDIDEILIDDDQVYREAKEFFRLIAPQDSRKLSLYDGTAPLFSDMQVESQIEKVFDRKVSLPSGGAIVIDHTEALTTIDINSARATRRGNIEETALHTNLEAADEVARQLRLRDLGGLIVIDFIDMTPPANQRRVENRLADAFKQDRARIRLGRISRFGLFEMSRQRLRPSLGESSQQVCPRCSGHGFIRTVESSALAVLRLMEEEALKEKVRRVVAQVPVEINSFLLNEKRAAINEIENRHGVSLVIAADIQMETPHYRVTCYRESDPTNKDKSSYQLVAAREPRPMRAAPRPQEAAEEAAVTLMSTNGKFPGKGLLSTLSRLFRKKPEQEGARAQPADGERGSSSRRGRRRRGGQRGGAGAREQRREQRGEQRGGQRGEPRDEPRAEQRGEQRGEQRAEPRDRRSGDGRQEQQAGDGQRGRRGRRRGQRGGQRHRRDGSGRHEEGEARAESRQRTDRGASARPRDDDRTRGRGRDAAAVETAAVGSAPFMPADDTTLPRESQPPYESGALHESSHESDAPHEPSHESQPSHESDAPHESSYESQPSHESGVSHESSYESQLPHESGTPHESLHDAQPAHEDSPPDEPPREPRTPREPPQPSYPAREVTPDTAAGLSHLPENAIGKAPPRDAPLPSAPSGLTQVETKEKNSAPVE